MAFLFLAKEGGLKTTMDDQNDVRPEGEEVVETTDTEAAPAEAPAEGGDENGEEAA